MKLHKRIIVVLIGLSAGGQMRSEMSPALLSARNFFNASCQLSKLLDRVKLPEGPAGMMGVHLSNIVTGLSNMGYDATTLAGKGGLVVAGNEILLDVIKQRYACLRTDNATLIRDAKGFKRGTGLDLEAGCPGVGCVDRNACFALLLRDLVQLMRPFMQNFVGRTTIDAKGESTGELQAGVLLSLHEIEQIVLSSLAEKKTLDGQTKTRFALIKKIVSASQQISEFFAQTFEIFAVATDVIALIIGGDVVFDFIPLPSLDQDTIKLDASGEPFGELTYDFSTIEQDFDTFFSPTGTAPSSSKKLEKNTLSELDEDIFTDEIDRTVRELPSIAQTPRFRLTPLTCTAQEAVDLVFEIPYLGSISFGTSQTEEGKEAVQAEVKFPAKPIVLGPLTIDNLGTMSFTGGQLSFTGTASLDLGYKKISAKMGLRELVFAKTETGSEHGKKKQQRKKRIRPQRLRVIERAVFGIELLGSVSDRELIPGLPLVIHSCDFILQAGRSPAIKLHCNAGSAPLDFSLSLDPKNASFVGTLKQFHPAELFPDLAGTDFENLVFDALIRLSVQKGLLIKSELRPEETVSLYGLALHKLIFDLDTTKKSAILHGTWDVAGLPASASFALGWGDIAGVIFSAGLDEIVKRWQPFIEIPEGDKKLEFLRTLTVENPELRLSFGLGVGKQLVESEDEKTGQTKKRRTKRQSQRIYLALNELKKKGTHVSATLAGTVRLGPLLADASKEIGKAAHLPDEIIGLIQPKEIEVDALFKLRISTKKKLSAVGLLSLPNSFTLTDVLPSEKDFKKSLGKKRGWTLYHLLNLVRIDHGTLVACLHDEIVDGIQYKTGLSIDTNIAIADEIQAEVLKKLPFLKGIFEKKGERGAGFHFLCRLDPFNLKNFALRIGVSTGDLTVSIPRFVKPPVIDIGPFDFSRLALDFIVRGDGVAVGCNFDFTPHEDPAQLPITCGGELKATATAVSGELACAGTWSNPFGIERLFRGGFKIGNLAFKLSELYENFAAIPETLGLSLLVPGAIGLAGRLELGKTHPLLLDFFFKLGLDLTDFAFEIMLKHPESLLYFTQDLIEALGLASKQKIKLGRFAIGKVEEASIKLSPFGGGISELEVKAGLGAALRGELFGARMGAMLSIMGNGIEMHGYLPDIKIGPLVISHAGGTGVDLVEQIKKFLKGSPPTQLGPEFKLVLKTDRLPELRVNGEVRLNLDKGDVLFKALSDIELSTERLAFNVKGQVGPSWAGLEAEIKAATIKIDDPLELLKSIQPNNLSLEISFTNTLTEQLLRFIDNFEKHTEIGKRASALIPKLLPLVKNIIGYVKIKKLYWKGSVADLGQAHIPGLIADIEINGRHFEGNLGDIDLNSPEDFQWSIAQIYLNLVRVGAAFLKDLLHIDAEIPICAPSVLVEFQNQSRDTIVVSEQRNGTKNGIPWWKKAGAKPYVIVDTLCLPRPKETKQPGPGPWLGLSTSRPAMASNTYTVSIQGQALFEVRAEYGLGGPRGERIECTISQIDASGHRVKLGTLAGIGTQQNFPIAQKGIAPSDLFCKIVKEMGFAGMQSKIKCYLLKKGEACTQEAWVEVMNQRKDLKVEIVDGSGDKHRVLHTAEQPGTWATLSPICAPAQGTASETYTILIDGKEKARVRCTFGTAGTQKTRKVEILDLSGKVLVSAVGGKVWYNFGTVRIKVEGLQEFQLAHVAGQSKFKIYVQKNGCGQNAVVEAQNQRDDMQVSIVSCDAEGRPLGDEVAVPYYGTTAYVTVDTLCQQASNPDIPTTGYYKISVNKKPLITVKCTFYATDKLEVSPIMVQSSTLPVNAILDKSSRKEWRIGDLVRLTVEFFKQSGQNKFKFYIERSTCPQDALVEATNQQSAEMVVTDLETNATYTIPNWKKKSWVPLPRICRPTRGKVEKFYLIRVDGLPFATIKCALAADGTMATQIRSGDNSCCLRDNRGKIQKLKHSFANYTAEIEAVNQGIPRQSKFKIRLQDKSWKSEGPSCDTNRCT